MHLACDHNIYIKTFGLPHNALHYYVTVPVYVYILYIPTYLIIYIYTSGKHGNTDDILEWYLHFLH